MQGSFLDKFFRHVSNFLSPFYYNFSKKYKSSTSTNFIFICYGGLGDYVLTFPFLNQLSSRYPVTIFVEKKFIDVSCLLNTNIEIKDYLKKDLLKELKFFASCKSNYILIQQSPIMEFMIFSHYLKRPPIVGFIYKQNLISFAGINLEDDEVLSINKIVKYNLLLEKILSIESKYTTYAKYNYINRKINSLVYKGKPNKNYYIISPTKNKNWKMGFLPFKTYAEFIISMSLRINLKPVIIGTKDDGFIINQILEHIPNTLSIKNLVGKTTIKDLVPLIKNANFVVTNDNGIHHISNFLKVRTLTLYNFSSYQVYNWPNKQSHYIFNPIFNCMPCIGYGSGPFDNYPFKCPWDVRCKNTISKNDIEKKLEDLTWFK